METSDDGERDWGAHVKSGDAALDQVRRAVILYPCFYCQPSASYQERYTVYNVTIIRIAEYINTVVGTRRITNNPAAPPAVVMKLDVEVRWSYSDSRLVQIPCSEWWGLVVFMQGMDLL